jgi:hypothetical protein
VVLSTLTAGSSGHSPRAVHTDSCPTIFIDRLRSDEGSEVDPEIKNTKGRLPRGIAERLPDRG